jgi:hypothetical protein
MAVAGVNDWNTRGRNFAIEPVLFVGECAPRGFHAFVAIEDRLTVRAFGKMRAVVGIFAEDFGLLHDVLPCWKNTYEQETRLQRSSNEGSVRIDKEPSHRASSQNRDCVIDSGVVHFQDSARQSV